MYGAYCLEQPDKSGKKLQNFGGYSDTVPNCSINYWYGAFFVILPVRGGGPCLLWDAIELITNIL